MIEFERDGEYVIEGTDVKAEYVGKSRCGFEHFLIDGVVSWMDDVCSFICSSGQYQGKRIIEKPKTYTVTVYVYRSNDGGHIWVDTKDIRPLFASTLIGKHEITVPYGAGL